MSIWELYCLPGRLVAELEYLFPGRGQVWATGRRRGHPFIHFLFSTAIYAIGGYFLFSALTDHDTKSQPTRPAALSSAAAASQDTVSQSSPLPSEAQSGAVEMQPDLAEAEARDAAVLAADIRRCETSTQVHVSDAVCPSEAMLRAGWTEESWAARARELVCADGTDGMKEAAGCLVRKPTNASDLRPGDEVRGPEWLRKPDPLDIMDLFPSAAQEQGVTGVAVLACTVARDGRLQGCTVDEETPQGFGFGDAALRLVGKMRMRPMLINGEPVNGGTVRIPIRFG